MANPPRNRVLIVDDDAAIRSIFQRLLEGAGYDVVAVSSGHEALRTLHDDPSIGLMLLDIDMPVMDGVAVRRAQRADPQIAGIPTVIVSGARGVRTDLDDLEADAFLDKPVTRQDLLAVVARYCAPEDRTE